MMAESTHVVTGTYRCPVCGHRDTVELDRDNATITCSYCETPLEVTMRDRESVRLSVQVAGEPTAH